MLSKRMYAEDRSTFVTPHNDERLIYSGRWTCDYNSLKHLPFPLNVRYVNDIAIGELTDKRRVGGADYDNATRRRERGVSG